MEKIVGMNTSKPLKNFLEISYEELEERNLSLKQKVTDHVSDEDLSEQIRKQLFDETRVKAITVGFTDLEGRFHMLDYDKKFLLKSFDNLTFDGSSVRGFTEVSESDLRLHIDWSSLKWLPSDIFGPGKVLVFSVIQDRDGSSYPSDLRGRLKSYVKELYSKEKIVTNFAVECEGFLFEGRNSEQSYYETGEFKLVSMGGYYHSLPCDPLRLYIDKLAEAQRALGFENEKDHPEVAPSQFEINYRFTDALTAADQLQLYKLTARQIAAQCGYTASFLPKPIAGINGSGMHTNMSLSKEGKNIFFDAKGEDNLSPIAWEFVDRILSSGEDLCLILNPSVNAYRRLDPNYEAPNQIKSSAVDRTAMLRIPLGNEKSARVECRTVAPDSNPYLAFYALLQTGLNGPLDRVIAQEGRKSRAKFLPHNIYDAIDKCSSSKFIEEFLGREILDKYVARKQFSADRCPKELGTRVKRSEVIFHHEVINQYLTAKF
jgi:glutamine synthetase